MYDFDSDYNMDWERENDWLDSADCQYFENYQEELIAEMEALEEAQR